MPLFPDDDPMKSVDHELYCRVKLQNALDPTSKTKSPTKQMRKAKTEQLPAKQTHKPPKEHTLRERYNDLGMVHSVRYTLSIERNLRQLKKVDLTPAIKDPALKTFSYVQKG